MFFVSLSIPWPVSVAGFYGFLSVFKLDLVSLTALNCAFATTFYSKFVLTILIPIVLSAACLVSVLLGWRFISQPLNKRVWYGQCCKVLSVALFFVYPTVSKISKLNRDFALPSTHLFL